MDIYSIFSKLPSYLSFAQQDATAGSAPVQSTGSNAAKVMNAQNALRGATELQKVPLQKDSLVAIPSDATQSDLLKTGLVQIVPSDDTSGTAGTFSDAAAVNEALPDMTKALTAAMKNMKSEKTYAPAWSHASTRLPSYILGR